MKRTIQNQIFFRCFLLLLCVFFLIICYQFFDVNFVVNLLEDSRNSIQDGGIYMALLIFLLRSVSIVVPILPGTYCAVISGYVFGIQTGLMLVFVADFLSCSASFFVSRKLGRGFVRDILGSRQMKKVEQISQKYLERNFFLMTGFLMTSWFDFVCYAVGLTKLSWKKFMPALIVSILISDLPFVAGGYTLSGLQDMSFSKVINGDVKLIEGPYLILLIISSFVIFGIGLFNVFFNSSMKKAAD